MRGTIQLKSEIGSGTLVTITLPFEKADTLAQADTTNENAILKRLNNYKILLAEDNKINQEITLAQLAKYGLHCDIANNGLECIERLKASKYDLVLMDIQMPILDGYSSAKKIRSDDAGIHNKDIPIFALTAHVSIDEQATAVEAGMNKHINKPVNPSLLVNEIYKILKPN